MRFLEVSTMFEVTVIVSCKTFLVLKQHGIGFRRRLTMKDKKSIFYLRINSFISTRCSTSSPDLLYIFFPFLAYCNASISFPSFESVASKDIVSFKLKKNLLYRMLQNSNLARILLFRYMIFAL